MAQKKTRKASSHVGGDGREYNGKKLTEPLPPDLRKKYAKKASR